MYEDVLAATIGRNEAESLAVVEPLHCSLHFVAPAKRLIFYILL